MQNRWFEAMKQSLRIWISWDQPMNRSRDPHDSAGDAKPTNATHSPQRRWSQPCDSDFEKALDDDHLYLAGPANVCDLAPRTRGTE
jgi:hypothetical protein